MPTKLGPETRHRGRGPLWRRAVNTWEILSAIQPDALGPPQSADEGALHTLGKRIVVAWSVRVPQERFGSCGRSMTASALYMTLNGCDAPMPVTE